MQLTAEDALQAYAEMINTLEIKHFLPLLADDFHYASQSVLAEISSKAEFAEYMTAKLETLKRSGVKTTAEMGRWQAYGSNLCALLSQNGHPVCTAIVKVEDRQPQHPRNLVLFFFCQPQRQTAAAGPPHFLRPVRHLEFHLRYPETAAGIVFVGHWAKIMSLTISPCLSANP